MRDLVADRTAEALLGLEAECVDRSKEETDRTGAGGANEFGMLELASSKMLNFDWKVQA